MQRNITNLQDENSHDELGFENSLSPIPPTPGRYIDYNEFFSSQIESANVVSSPKILSSQKNKRKANYHTLFTEEEPLNKKHKSKNHFRLKSGVTIQTDSEDPTLEGIKFFKLQEETAAIGLEKENNVKRVYQRIYADYKKAVNDQDAKLNLHKKFNCVILWDYPKVAATLDWQQKEISALDDISTVIIDEDIKRLSLALEEYPKNPSTNPSKMRLANLHKECLLYRYAGHDPAHQGKVILLIRNQSKKKPQSAYTTIKQAYDLWLSPEKNKVSIIFRQELIIIKGYDLFAAYLKWNEKMETLDPLSPAYYPRLSNINRLRLKSGISIQSIASSKKEDAILYSMKFFNYQNLVAIGLETINPDAMKLVSMPEKIRKTYGTDKGKIRVSLSGNMLIFWDYEKVAEALHWQQKTVSELPNILDVIVDEDAYIIPVVLEKFPQYQPQNIDLPEPNASQASGFASSSHTLFPTSQEDDPDIFLTEEDVGLPPTSSYPGSSLL